MISVVLAGGRGVRLWPESTDSRPKQLCDFFGQGSLLVMTLQRLKPLGTVIVVCGQDQEGLIKDDVSHLDAKILSEPVGRNTAPAVGLVLSQKLIDNKEVIGVFPADHYIKDDDEFCRVVRKAEELARKGFLVTIGIKPERPETGYGYIERDAGKESYRVKAFHEKPDQQTAEHYIKAGNYYWNAGIFLATAEVWGNLVEKHLPQLFKNIAKGNDDYLNAYPSFPSISIDYGIAEKCSNMAVIVGDFGWNDIGSWESLAEVLEKDENGNSVNGNALVVDSSGCLVRTNGKKVVVFGLNDIVVVECEDTVLVCPKRKSQDIKRLVEMIEPNKSCL
ncbi:mannose-1-phosphate guanylyltransferase [Syntrophomonas erecta]